jgi:hypothetical protein
MRAAILGAVLTALLTGCEIRKPPAAQPIVWKRYTIPNGTCSAEFPFEPHNSDKGLDMISLVGPHFFLGCDDVPIIPEGITDEGLLDLFRDRMRENGNGEIAERKIVVDGCAGREWESIQNHLNMRLKVVIRGGKIYLAAGVGAVSDQDKQNMKRFTDSFRFEQPKP